MEGGYYGARSNGAGRLPKFLVVGRGFAHKIGKNTEFLCRNHIFFAKLIICPKPKPP